jgi:hypothetical protein
MRWTGHLARKGETINACKSLVGKPERKKQFGRLRRRWEDNIGMDLGEIGGKDVYCIHLDQWRAFVNTVMDLRIP